MNKLRAITVAFLFAGAAMAQTASQAPGATPTPGTTAQAPQQQRPAPPPPKDTAKPEDVKSIDSTVAALYDVISGPAGPRNWDRLRSLFTPDAHMLVTGKRPDGTAGFRSMTVDEYISRSSPIIEKEGFFERGASNKVDNFGSIANVFSTYESRHEKDGQPFARGINTIQLVFGWGRWWISGLAWDQERPDNQIPEKYTK